MRWISRPAIAAIAPEARCAAIPSIQRPLPAGNPSLAPSPRVRARRPSSPPVTTASPLGSSASASAAPRWTSTARGAPGSPGSAGRKWTRPAPVDAASVAPSAAKASPVTNAPSSSVRAGTLRVSAAAATSALERAGREAALERLAVELAADEDQLAGARIVLPPGLAPVGVHHHVHGLEDEAPILALDREHALRAQDVGALLLQHAADPHPEAVGVHRAVEHAGDRGDAVVVDVVVMVVVVIVVMVVIMIVVVVIMLMVMIVVVPALLQELGLDREDALQIERAAVEDLVERDPALLGAVDARVAVDPPDLGLDLRQLLGRHEVGLVEQNHVGEGDLVLGLVAVGEPVEEELGVDHGHHRVELGLGAHLVVDEEGLRDRRRVGQPGGLDDHPVQLVGPLHQPADHAYQIAAHGAADAAVVHLEHLLVGADDEVVVDADLPELVDDHRVAFAVMLGEDAVEQRRLAGAEIAGEHGDGDLARLGV